MNEIATLPEQRPEAPAALEKARSVVIVTVDDYKAADLEQMGLQKLEKLIVDDFKPSRDAATKAFNAAKASTTAIREQEAKHLEPVQEARRVLKSKMSNWQDEQELLRREEERKLREQARKLEEDRQIAEAELAEKAGDKETAQAILEQPVVTPPVVLPRAVPKSATLIRKIKKYRVLDPSKVKRDFLILDEVKIGQVVRSMGQAAEALVGGIQVYEEAC